MKHRALPFLTVVVLTACQGGDSLRPNADRVGPPSFLISDGTKAAGNRDFFFLPPMVKDPSANPFFNAGGFDGTQLPIVDICELDAATEDAVNGNPPSTPPAPCKSVGYSASYQLTAANVSLTDQKYQINWGVPVSAAVYFKITIKLDATTVLGFADVATGQNGAALKNVTTGDFVPLVDGRTLPIKFRIEQGAVCGSPAGCGSGGVVNFASGGTVTTDESGVQGGVTIPPQPGSNVTTTITVEPCVADIPSDLPHFGPCVSVTANPPTGVLAVPATVFVCNLDGTSGLSHSQEERITLHSYDATPTPTIKALPHAVDPCGSIFVAAAPTWSLRGLLADLRHGRLKSAGRQVVGLLGPKPLYAAMFLDEGGGGSTDGFTDYQFLLPAKFVDCGGNGQSAPVGTTLSSDPTVCVKDLGDEAVAGATVHFSDGAVSLGSFTTLSDGKAAVNWTIGTLGANSLKASGDGIAGTDFNGPRGGSTGTSNVDPFIPFPFHPQPPTVESGPPSGAVQHVRGSLTFTATGTTGSPLPLAFGSSGYASKVIPFGSGAPAGWETLAFDAAGDGFNMAATTPFGDAATSTCGNYTGAGTPWGVDTDILVRKVFNASAGTITIRIVIDNDLGGVWLNGAPLSGGVVTHGGCAVENAGDNTILTGTAIAGTNVLAIRGKDRGVAAYLNVQVTQP